MFRLEKVPGDLGAAFQDPKVAHKKAKGGLFQGHLVTGQGVAALT